MNVVAPAWVFAMPDVAVYGDLNRTVETPVSVAVPFEFWVMPVNWMASSCTPFPGSIVPSPNIPMSVVVMSEPSMPTIDWRVSVVSPIDEPEPASLNGCACTNFNVATLVNI